MKNVRIISLLFVVVFLFSTVGCSTSNLSNQAEITQVTEIPAIPAPTATPVTLENLEVERAIKAGLVPEELQTNLDQPITFSEFTKMLTNLVKIWNPDKLDNWAALMTIASKADDKMKRIEGMVEIGYLVKMMYAIHIDEPIDNQIERVHKVPEANYRNEMRSVDANYQYFKDVHEIVYPQWGNCDYICLGVLYSLKKDSKTTSLPIFTYDLKSNSAHMGDPLTRKDAILATLRLAETDTLILTKRGDAYVSLAEAGTYNKAIITDELLNKPTDLPIPTQSQLPSTWKGAGMGSRKDANHPYQDFKESDIRFLAENGMNFTRVFFHFSTLQYPDYPEDKTQVSVKQLEDLDQLIAWGMKYGVHIQISSQFFFGITDPLLGISDISMAKEEDWKLLADYWSMLARRYAGIPSKYLSFDLINEDQPTENIAFAVTGIKGVRDSILKEDPNRILINSYMGNPNLEWVDAVASLGIAIGIHPYYPNVLTTIDLPYLLVNPFVGQPQWPYVWFPGGKFSNDQEPLIITGDISSGGQVLFSCESYSEGANVSVYLDGKFDQSYPASGGEWDGSQYQCHGNPAVIIDIPPGTQEIKIISRIGRVDTVVFKGAVGEVHMNTNDAADNQDFSDPLPLVINSDGTYTNSENKMITAETIYEVKIKPMIEIAQKYNVGYMVNEFGSFCTYVPYEAELIDRYTDDLLAMLEAHQIGWNLAEMTGTPSNYFISPIDSFSWVGTRSKQVIYTFDDGHTELFYESENFMDVFRKYTMADQ
jgi:hypothetical protein